jgi:Zn finger protein HypA/HybF involved in hydrogenase expression
VGKRGRIESPIVEITCPRCSSVVDEHFYGPCELCRSQLREIFQTEGRVVDVVEYEPKMNVTPNAVALKDD